MPTSIVGFDPRQEGPYHAGVCRGAVRPCQICGGRMCRCLPGPNGERVFTCIHCGATEPIEQSAAGDA